MGNVKIGFTVGGISFSGEGEDTWIEKQLDKIIAKAPELIKIVPVQSDIPEGSGENIPKNRGIRDSSIGVQTLPNYLQSKNATKSQSIKFLATSIWLHAKGKNRLSTGDVTKALKDSNQSRLGNPSDCLAQNITKGNIEREGKEFFVTDEGKKSL
jgi:hypothetical protein